MGTLVSSHQEKGVLLDITVRISTEEANAYRSFIQSDVPKCPHCGAPIELRPDDMHINIYSPLNPLFGMEMGRPQFDCIRCGKRVEVMADMDLHAFPSIIQYLTRLRQEYKKRLELAKTRSKGIVINGNQK